VTDIATLGLKIQSDDADKAKSRLDSMVGAAKRAELAAKGLSSSSTNASAKILAVASAADREASALKNASAIALKAANSNRQFERAAQASKFATANMAAQFQDVGVQLASGQSPFLIAIQQGTQLSAVLNTMEKGSVLKGLAASFGSMVNPISLATFAAIGLGGTMVQYFTGLLSSTDEAKTALKDHASLIQDAAKKWGDALPAVRAYADELTRQKDAADRAAAINQTINHLLDSSKSTFAELKANVAGLSTQFFSLGGAASDVGNAFYGAQLSMANLEAKIRDGKQTAGDFSTVATDLANLLGNDAIRSNNALVTSLTSLRNAYLQAATAAATLKDQAGLPGKEGRVGMPTMDEAQSQYDVLLGLRRRMDPDAFPQIKLVKETGAALKAAAANAIDPWEGMRKVSAGVAAQMRAMQREADHTAQFWSSTANGFTHTFINGLKNGEDAWHAFGDAAENALETVTDKRNDDALDALMAQGEMA
jgi:hypothetical protein